MRPRSRKAIVNYLAVTAAGDGLDGGGAGVADSAGVVDVKK